MTAFVWCSYHFYLKRITLALQIFKWIRFPILSFLLLHSLWASLEHSRTVWFSVSSALLYILHMVCSCDLLIFSLITLVRMACSWAGNIRLSVSRFRIPFRKHCHLSSFPTSSVCCTKWPCNFFFFSQKNCSFFLLLLLSLNYSFSD